MPKTAKRGRPPVEGLTPKQRETLRAVKSFMTYHGHPPTISELAGMLQVTGSTAFASVDQLVRKGFLKRESKSRRGIFIAREPRDEVNEQVEIPVLGRVAAGPLNYAEQNVVDRVSVDAVLVRNGRHFGLKVVGDSMIGAGIKNGDTVIVREQPLAENWDIVVACVGDEATVKRLSYSRERIELQPENPKYGPIMIDHDEGREFRIVGRVVTHLRKSRK